MLLISPDAPAAPAVVSSMSIPADARGQNRRFSFGWLTDRPHDLTWYIGSSLAGWLYAGAVLLAVWLLADPLHDAFGVIRLGGLEIPLTLQFLVFSSWAFLLDAPHLFSTIARTFFDPEERRVRRRELRLSWSFFLVGPAAVLLPHALRLFLPVPDGVLPLGAVLFTLFFRIWAYYHVVRQHWGFVALYRRKNGELDRTEQKREEWVFYLLLWAPVVMFLTGPYFAQTPGMPRLPLEGHPGIGVVHWSTWAVFLGTVLYYAAQQVTLWRQGKTLNGPKLLLLAGIVPLHLITFNSPWLAAMLLPIVTVGYNIQYLQWLQTTTGIALDRSVLHGVGMMAGLSAPAAMTLGQQLFGVCLLGWAMQHYYLDAKIWRVGKDQAVARQLGV
ncbi:MAG TPA: hypothetical protein VK464_27835 [Symbiobacteriaceae bacterium]|nr:hypothetical protein [Symbiobacteriaceae bacterium]